MVETTELKSVPDPLEAVFRRKRKTHRLSTMGLVETTELEGGRAGAGSCSPIPARVD